MNIVRKIHNKQLTNALWMMSEKFISIVGLLFITSSVAKYIGVSLFGQLALAIAIFQIIQIAAQLGSDNVVFKRVSRNAASGIKLIRSTLSQRCLIYLSLASPVLLWQFFYASELVFYFFSAVALASFFSALDVYAIYYNATLQSRINALINTLGLIIGFGCRYAVVGLALSPAWLALAIIITTLLPLMLRWYMLRSYFAIALSTRRRRKYQRYLLNAGVSLVIASVSVAIYSRIAQLLLAWLAGSHAVGLYSVASSLATSWTFVTAALITSSFTAIFQCKDELHAQMLTTRLQRQIFIIAIGFVLLLCITGYPLIKYLYGDAYLGAWPILVVLACASLFSALGPIFYRYIVHLSGFRFLSLKSLALFIFSLPITVVMIYFYGVIGAAVSTLIIEIVSLTLFNYPFAQGAIWKIHKHALIYRKNKNEKMDQSYL